MFLSRTFIVQKNNKETQFQAFLLIHLNWVVRNGIKNKAQKC